MNLREVYQMFQNERSVGLTWPFPADLGEWGAVLQVTKRSLFLFNEVQSQDEEDERNGVGWLIKGLYTLDEIDHTPITLYINSPGGSISAGMALINVMRDLTSPVNTFVVGEAASMAGVIAVAGSKRFAYSTARWLLHRGKSSASGDADDIEIEAKELKTVDSYADQVIVNASGGLVDHKKLAYLQRKNYWLGAEQAKKHGLLDEIVVPRQGWANWIPDKTVIASKVMEDEDAVAEGKA